MKAITLDDINKLITQARKQFKSYELPFDIKDITILIGKNEFSEIKNFTYTGIHHSNGFQLFKKYGINFILTNDESRLEACWIIPTISSY